MQSHFSQLVKSPVSDEMQNTLLKVLRVSEGRSCRSFEVNQNGIIAKHAHATNAMVAAQDRGDDLLLTMADDGQGMSTELNRGKRTLGVLGMCECVNMLGRVLTIGSLVGDGAHIEATIPRNGLANP